MKNIFFLISLCTAATSFAATNYNRITAQHKPDSVTVYQAGALVTRSADVALKKGRNIIVFSNIPDNINTRTKKDFIDMYFLLQHYSLKEVLDFYARKYPENSMFRALMSLSYFEDAEEQIMPKMFSSVTWEEMKQFITAQVSRL